MENVNITKSLTLGSGDVVEVIVDNSGIQFKKTKKNTSFETVSFDTIHYYFSTKRGSEDELVNLIASSKLLQQLLIEVDLGISDEEGVAEMIADDPAIAGKMKTLTNFNI